MNKLDTLIVDFEKAVRPEISQLSHLAAEAGIRAVAELEKRPEIDPWLVPQAEMQHCINNALNILGAVMFGEFDSVAQGVERYSARLRGLEEKIDIEPKPSELLGSIKQRIDTTIRDNPDVFAAPNMRA